jgi:parvulin-like peptidyl-prolyl isomerase
MRRYTSRRKKALRNLTVVTIIFAIGFLTTKILNLKSKQDDVLVAKMGKEKIYKSEIERKLQTIFADEQQLIAVPALETLPKEVVEIVVKEIYSDRQILKLAKKEGFEKQDSVREKIANFQEKTIRQAYLDSIIEKEITKEKVSEKYAEITNSLSGKKEYQIAHILTKSKEDADKILLELNSKKTLKFSELAKRYSLEQQSAQNGGDLGFILEDNITKEIADELINLKIDDVSAPIKTKLGWHLVKLLDSREAKAITFEESKDKIREQLIQNKINELNNSLIAGSEVKLLMEFEKEKITKDNPDSKTDDSKSSIKDEPNKESTQDQESKPEQSNDQSSQKENKDNADNENKSSDQKKSPDKISIDKNSQENSDDKSNDKAVDKKSTDKSSTDKSLAKSPASSTSDNNDSLKIDLKKNSDKNSANAKESNLSKDSKKNNDDLNSSKAKEGKKNDNSKTSKTKNPDDKVKTKN